MLKTLAKGSQRGNANMSVSGCSAGAGEHGAVRVDLREQSCQATAMASGEAGM